jgi:hypothetical protein
MDPNLVLKTPTRLQPADVEAHSAQSEWTAGYFKIKQLNLNLKNLMASTMMAANTVKIRYPEDSVDSNGLCTIICPKNCIICNSISTDYGDDKNGYIFCKDCFDMYSCLHCKKMNISIYGKKLIVREFFGRRFLLFCQRCWEKEDVYSENKIELEEEEIDNMYDELSDSDLLEEEETNQEEMNDHDLYHTTKGKYDLY